MRAVYPSRVRLNLLPNGFLTASFAGLAVLAGWSGGLMLRVNPVDRAVRAVEFAVRNVGIAAVSAHHADRPVDRARSDSNRPDGCSGAP
jgi:hypothetical protein